MAPSSRSPALPALDLLEQGMHLLRRTPATDFLIWLAGVVPFTVALLFFWAEMSRAAHAEARLFLSAWSLAGLFVWLKTCQAVFASRLLARASADETATWNLRTWLGVFVTQAALQPLLLVALPVAAVLTLPLGWVFAWTQNVSVLAARTPHRPGELLRLAWRQCLLWPGQNHSLLALVSIAWLVAALNAAIALYTAPHLLKMLFGIESRLTLSPGALLNTTFLAIVVALGALAVDPLLKAAYALRCLHGFSRHSGDDLRARLKWLRQTAVLALLWGGLVFGPPVMAAAEEAVPPSARIAPAELDRAIADVLERPEFTWRSPRDWQLAEPDAELGWLGRQMKALDEQLERLFRSLGRPVRAIVDWLEKALGGNRGPKTPTGNFSINFAALAEFLLWLLVIAVALVLGWFAYRLWRPRRPAEETVPAAGPAMPDLRAEFVAADQLPEDGWLALAQRLLDEGDHRLALRAFYLAALAHLARREFIRLARHKSNLDYALELRRRARARPEVIGLFTGAAREFDRVWYGGRATTADGLVEFAAQVEEMRRS